MSTLVEILSPDFLLRDALVGSVLVGIVCPLVGAYFVLRRMIFLGVALPQLSAAGIAASFVFFQLVVGPHEHGQVSERARPSRRGSASHMRSPRPSPSSSSPPTRTATRRW